MRFRLHAAAQRSAEQKDGGDREVVRLRLVDGHRDASDVHVHVVRSGVHHVQDDHHLRRDNQHRRNRCASEAGDRRRGTAAARAAKGQINH